MTAKGRTKKASADSFGKRFLRSTWPFPVALALIVLLFTAFKISGSSVGIWNHLLYGAKDNDANVLLGHPRMIRSDEWELNTPMTVGQARNGLKRINQNVGQGQDMSLMDVPYKDWSTLFKPHNWPFFILPLEHAFAMKWWLLIWLLIVMSYYLFLFFVPGKRLLAGLFSLCVYFSPFLQWWSLGTITLLGYGLAVLLCALYVLKDKQTPRQRWLLAALLAYTLTAFGLLLYPPFQIGIVLVAGAFLLGVIGNNYQAQKDGRKYLMQTAKITIVPALIAVCFVGLFFATRLPALKALNGTVYPGHRVVPSGGFEFSRFFSGPVLEQLQDDMKATKYGYNQSEAANFILFPFLLVVLAWIAHKYRRQKKLDWRIVGLLVITTILLLRIFMPHLPLVSKLLLLEAIPHVRLLMAFGLINMLSIILVVEYLHRKDMQLPPRLIGLVWLATFLCFAIAGLNIRHMYPEFINSAPKILLICLATSLVVPLLLFKRFTWALGLLLAISFVTCGYVNPLYRGLGPLTNSALSKDMRAIGEKDKASGWVVAEPGTFENMAIANGLRSVSGVYIYPQLSLWEPLKKQPQDQDIYNRFAHVFFTVDDKLAPDQSLLDPPALDAFRARTSPCSTFLKQNNIRYILTTEEHHASCVTKIKDITYPAVPFKVYHIEDRP